MKQEKKWKSCRSPLGYLLFHNSLLYKKKILSINTMDMYDSFYSWYSGLQWEKYIENIVNENNWLYITKYNLEKSTLESYCQNNQILLVSISNRTLESDHDALVRVSVPLQVVRRGAVCNCTII